MATNSLSRSMHDLGLSAWFGGTLANAVALNPAAAAAGDARSTTAVTNAGWDRWAPLNAAAVGVHLVGSVGQLLGNRDRLRTQKGVGQMAGVKTVLTVAAVGASVYSRVLGKRISDAGAVPAASGTEPSAGTPAGVAQAQRQLDVLQWAVPALTGGLVAVTSFAGEQQRPAAVAAGVVSRVTQR